MKHIGAWSTIITGHESTSPEDRALSPGPAFPGDLRHMTWGLRSPAVRVGVALRRPDPAHLTLGMEGPLEVLTHTKHGTRRQRAGLSPPQAPDKLLSGSHSRNRVAPQPWTHADHTNPRVWRKNGVPTEWGGVKSHRHHLLLAPSRPKQEKTIVPWTTDQSHCFEDQGLPHGYSRGGG